MIVHLYVPEFFAQVQARAADRESSPVAVCDEARVLSVNTAGRQQGVKPGQLLENNQLPPEVERLEFDISIIEKQHSKLRRRLEKLSPIVENLELGEFFVEVENKDKVFDWFKQLDYPLPLTGAVAPTGWLARIVSRRQQAGEIICVEEDEYEEFVKKVQIDEIWGFGGEFVKTLADKDFKELGELYYLEEIDKRKLLGSDSRLLHQVFEGEDPRSINVFSRPRSLSRELVIPADKAQEKDEIIDKVDPVLDKFQARLQATVSLTHRLRVGLRFEDQRDLVRSHIFTAPVCDSNMLRFAFRQMMSSVALTVPVKTVAVETDIIVADLENYHRKSREAAMSFEVIDS
ncbi:MAG: hypothetical protein ACQEP7_04010 [bacterium]